MFRSYLKGRVQYVKLACHLETDFESINFRMLQGSILGSLHFLLYANNLQNCSKRIDTIIFADDTNLFYEPKNLEALFSTVNKE